ncbi:MAG: L,D-transpeptidase [Hyphomicrobium sp.]|nr:MAG: L,D-transpeptidase [Hyphomicrobium sp.]
MPTRQTYRWIFERVPRYAALAMLLGGILTFGARVDAKDATHDQPLKAQADNSGPHLVLISLRKQRLKVYNASGEITSSRISSGKPGFDTPTGVFSILEKKQHHVSNIYAGAAMPFMQRLTWSGIAMHAGQVPGYRASHGCIRLPYSFSKSLFGLTKHGARVIVTQDETRPVPFEHDKLFKPLPLRAPEQIISLSNKGTKVASNDANFATLTSDGVSELPRIFGITPALAEAVADYHDDQPARPITRSEAESFVQQKIATISARLRTLSASRAGIVESAKSANQKADLAAAKLANLRRSLVSQPTNLQDAEKTQQTASSSYIAFMTAIVAAIDGNRDDLSDDKEAELEDALLDATHLADTSRVEAAKHEMAMAEAQALASAAQAAREAAISAVRQSEIDIKSTTDALAEAKREAARWSKPLSIFISLKTERIHLRQGVDPVLEAAITFDGKIREIGTHVLTAMRYSEEDPNSFDWQLVTARAPVVDGRDKLSKKLSARETSRPPQSIIGATNAASSALEAIKIPQNVQDKITELMKPGSSLIISDRELNKNENGLGTEFVLLTR